MSGSFQRFKRCFSVVLCAALVLAITCMAMAVLVQALAVLVIAVLAATLLLPHPLKWYAREAAEALSLFLNELFGKTASETLSQAPAERKAPENERPENR